MTRTGTPDLVMRYGPDPSWIVPDHNCFYFFPGSPKGTPGRGGLPKKTSIRSRGLLMTTIMARRSREEEATKKSRRPPFPEGRGSKPRSDGSLPDLGRGFPPHRRGRRPGLRGHNDRLVGRQNIQRADRIGVVVMATFLALEVSPSPAVLICHMAAPGASSERIPGRHFEQRSALNP
jgi:hypothetical protein